MGLDPFGGPTLTAAEAVGFEGADIERDDIYFATAYKVIPKLALCKRWCIFRLNTPAQRETDPPCGLRQQSPRRWRFGHRGAICARKRRFYIETPPSPGNPCGNVVPETHIGLVPRSCTSANTRQMARLLLLKYFYAFNFSNSALQRLMPSGSGRRSPSYSMPM